MFSGSDTNQRKRASVAFLRICLSFVRPNTVRMHLFWLSSSHYGVLYAFFGLLLVLDLNLSLKQLQFVSISPLGLIHPIHRDSLFLHGASLWPLLFTLFILYLSLFVSLLTYRLLAMICLVLSPFHLFSFLSTFRFSLFPSHISAHGSKNISFVCRKQGERPFLL